MPVHAEYVLSHDLCFTPFDKDSSESERRKSCSCNDTLLAQASPCRLYPAPFFPGSSSGPAKASSYAKLGVSRVPRATIGCELSPRLPRLRALNTMDPEAVPSCWSGGVANRVQSLSITPHVHKTLSRHVLSCLVRSCRQSIQYIFGPAQRHHGTLNYLTASY